MKISKYKNLCLNDVLFFYEGVFKYSNLLAFVKIIENKINMIDETLCITASKVIVEVAQNLISYVSKDEKSLILIDYKKETNEFFIFSINSVNKNTQKKLKNILEKLQNMNEEEIKTNYKSLRRSGKYAHEKGAGLGFLEIFKASKKIEFEFEEINKDKFKFSFLIKL